MGIEDDFYATIKFKSGEEIYAKVAASDEGDRTLLLLHNPIVIEEVKARGSIAAYKFEPWLKTSREDMFIVNLEDILTMSESQDSEMITNYCDYVSRVNRGNLSKLDKKMGKIGTVKNARASLEKLYKLNTKDIPTEESRES